MKIQKRYGIRYICYMAPVLCLLMIMLGSCRGTHANRKAIQYTDIEKVYIGMPLDSVFLVLGQPYAFGSNLGCHDLTCKSPRVVSDIGMTKGTDIIHVIDSIYQDSNYCCKANREMMRNIDKNATLTYTKKPSFLMSFLKSYPMLWVHLDSVYRVSGVYAKYYEADDRCIYSLSSNTLFSDGESREDHIEFFVDTTLFRKCFPIL